MSYFIQMDTRKCYLDVFRSCSLSSNNVWGAGFAGGPVEGVVLTEAETGDGFSSSVNTWNIKSNTKNENSMYAL